MQKYFHIYQIRKDNPPNLLFQLYNQYMLEDQYKNYISKGTNHIPSLWYFHNDRIRKDNQLNLFYLFYSWYIHLYYHKKHTCSYKHHKHNHLQNFHNDYHCKDIQQYFDGRAYSSYIKFHYHIQHIWVDIHHIQNYCQFHNVLLNNRHRYLLHQIYLFYKYHIQCRQNKFHIYPDRVHINL